MKTIKTVMHQLTDTVSILQALRETLREIDPCFPEEESRFLKVAEALEQEIGDSVSPTASAFLAAKETAFASELIFIGWQGFLLNQDIFRNPVNALTLEADHAELYQEKRLGSLPAVRKARDVEEAFHAALKALPKEKQCLTDEISDFYAYLQTIGYKLAHYFGFRLADDFLQYVVPGYFSNSVHTMEYAAKLQNYLKVEFDRME